MDQSNQVIAKLPLKVDLFIRQAYYGGRTEVFKPYVAKGYQYDVNSSYPAGMIQPMPVGRPSYIEFTEGMTWTSD